MIGFTPQDWAGGQHVSFIHIESAQETRIPIGVTFYHVVELLIGCNGGKKALSSKRVRRRKDAHLASLEWDHLTLPILGPDLCSKKWTPLVTPPTATSATSTTTLTTLPAVVLAFLAPLVPLCLGPGMDVVLGK
jgi:hypothetical protein